MTECVLTAQYPVVQTALSPVESEFQALFVAEFGYVYKTLRRFGVAERDLPDLCHELFVAVFRRFDDFDRSRPIRPWLCGFATRVAADYRRLARHRFELVDATSAEERGADSRADGAFRALEARDLVLKGLSALDLDRRAVLVMHDIDGHAMPDIARALGVPLNTAYSRLRLARADFRAAVNRIRPEGGTP